MKVSPEGGEAAPCPKAAVLFIAAVTDAGLSEEQTGMGWRREHGKSGLFAIHSGL
jgi:hypothetical protein